MRQAIVTKYLGPTDHRGARVRATADAGKVTIQWDDALNVNANHTQAAKALATFYGWDGQWFGGALPTNDGNCYVQCPYVGSHAWPEEDDDNFYLSPVEDSEQK